MNTTLKKRTFLQFGLNKKGEKTCSGFVEKLNANPVRDFKRAFKQYATRTTAFDTYKGWVSFTETKS